MMELKDGTRVLVGVTESSIFLHLKLSILFFFLRFYLFMRDTEREAEGEAGFTQGARCGTRSWVSRIRPWAEGRLPAEPSRDP